MPTYAYACTACGHEFDAQQSFSEASLTDCPVCGGRLRKKFGAVGVVFKGSGFYRTDSRDAASTVPAAPAKDAPAKDSATKTAPAPASAPAAPAAAAS